MHFQHVVPGYSCNSNWPWKCSPGSFLWFIFQLILKFRSEVELKSTWYFLLPSVHWIETKPPPQGVLITFLGMSLNQPAATKTSHPHGEIPPKTMGGNDGRKSPDLVLLGKWLLFGLRVTWWSGEARASQGKWCRCWGEFFFNGKKCGIFGNDM